MASEQRLIDANKLESKLQEHHDFFVDGVGGFRFLSPKDKARVDEITNCIAEVCNAPTVDAVEVKHGRWEHDCVEGCNPFVDSLPIWVDVMQCSVCKEYIEGSHGTNYCPNCGAKMDGDGDE